MMGEFSTFYIKNMVCPRCIYAVKQAFEEIGHSVLEIDLGYAKVSGKPNKADVEILLKNLGFELLTTNDEKLVNKVKSIIINLVQTENLMNQNLSDYLSQSLNLDYHYLSNLFSSTSGLTIERYFILQRIEKVKELLVYDELSLKEIAFKLGYSSVAHLSSQFKKNTGFTTTHFKEIGLHKRKSLDNLNP